MSSVGPGVLSRWQARGENRTNETKPELCIVSQVTVCLFVCVDVLFHWHLQKFHTCYARRPFEDSGPAVPQFALTPTNRLSAQRAGP